MVESLRRSLETRAKDEKHNWTKGCQYPRLERKEGRKVGAEHYRKKKQADKIFGYDTWRGRSWIISPGNPDEKKGSREQGIEKEGTPDALGGATDCAPKGDT